jgi:hypothetical protein
MVTRMFRRTGRLLAAAVMSAAGLVVLAGCSSADVQQATSLASSAASSVAGSLHDVTGGAVEKGMSSVAGGIDGAIAAALQGADVTSSGTLPTGFPSAAVPVADGTVVGGGAGPNDLGWVAQIRVDSLAAFQPASARLAAAGFASGTTHSDASSAFGLFTSSRYRVILTMSKNSDGVTATYIVTKK